MKEVKGEVIRFRLTTEEKDIIRKEAEKVGLSLTDYMRIKIFGKAK